MTSPAKNIADHLQAEGHGTFGAASGWSIAVAREPETPDNVITIYDTPGQPPHPDANNFSRPSIQARIRAGHYPDAYSKANDVRQSLILPKSLDLGNYHYVGIWAVDDIALLRFDENNRPIVVINFDIIREDA